MKMTMQTISRWSGCGSRFQYISTRAVSKSVGVVDGCKLPTNPIEMISQSRKAIETALASGANQQKIEFLLPVNEKQFDFLAIEAIDYPCSLRDEFDACCSLTKAVLQQLTNEKEFLERRLDDGGVEGEPCMAIYPASKEIIAVVFPTADRLDDLKSLAKNPSIKSLWMVNPQWNDSGQVVSDFGFGPWKKAAEDFLKQFQVTYYLREQRVGSPGSADPTTGERYFNGAVVRTLLCSSQGYEIFVLASDGRHQQVGTFDHQPSYQELERMLQDARKQGLEIFDILKQTSIAEARGLEFGIKEKGNIADGEMEDITENEIDAMDASTLRQMLLKRGLPTSGRIAKLKERLKSTL